jgi:hypothetical protein
MEFKIFQRSRALAWEEIILLIRSRYGVPDPKTNDNLPQQGEYKLQPRQPNGDDLIFNSLKLAVVGVESLEVEIWQQVSRQIVNLVRSICAFCCSSVGSCGWKVLDKATEAARRSETSYNESW